MRKIGSAIARAGALIALVTGCARSSTGDAATTSAAEGARSGAAESASAESGFVTVTDDTTRTTLPAGADDAQARLAASPRHGEWVMIAAGKDSIRAWIVYPERSTPAPVVIVIHEIFGLSHWIRAVTDQLAAEGFVAIAPDLLTTRNLPGAPADTPGDAARAAIQTLQPSDVQRWLGATARWGASLPSTTDRYGVVGFCWGGRASFAHAVHAPDLDAAVVFYGESPAPENLANVRSPVLGLYAADDERVNATVPAADSAMRALGKPFESHFFTEAGHGFLRAQAGRDGANMSATREAWPLTLAWFRRHLES